MIKNFIDELIDEIEKQEQQKTEAYYDLILIQIRELQKQIEYNFSQAELECNLIKDFVIKKNLALQEKINWFELKLEAFIKERGLKTITLPNGTLKMHKKPDKIEIEDLQLFLKNANPELITIIPEQVRPDLNKIKSYIKNKPIPPGIKIIEGKEEFSYKLNGETNEREKETGIGVEQTTDIRTAV